MAEGNIPVPEILMVCGDQDPREHIPAQTQTRNHRRHRQWWPCRLTGGECHWHSKPRSLQASPYLLPDRETKQQALINNLNHFLQPGLLMNHRMTISDTRPVFRQNL
ncbi:hypothetical protein ES705_46824 [subsurface metagenome]